jgi:hypothetical protein
VAVPAGAAVIANLGRPPGGVKWWSDHAESVCAY